jgi:flagellar protein FlgJ
MLTVSAAPAPGAPITAPDSQQRLHAAAAQLEATFLAEMLRAAGLGKTPEAFGGGVGEDQFATMLVQAQADALVRAGGIGLAQSLVEAMTVRVGDV